MGAIDVDFCTKAGFSSNLLCSSCGQLEGFNLKDIEADCLKCCINDVEEESMLGCGVCAWCVCSSCGQLEGFNLKDIEADCLKCCINDVEEESM